MHDFVGIYRPYPVRIRSGRAYFAELYAYDSRAALGIMRRQLRGRGLLHRITNAKTGATVWREDVGFKAENRMEEST